MKPIILTILNLGLVVFFILLFRRKNLLSFHQDGRIWLTYLAVGIITLMDEFTSVFYAPAESYRFIGLSAIIFIAITSLLVRFISTRLTEIAEILEHHQLIGGGVYSFSYLVLGPLVSFVAVSSIMVDYILTACISAVSAVSNAASFFPLSKPALDHRRAGHHLGRGRPEYFGDSGKRPVHLPDLCGRRRYHAQSHHLRPPQPGCLCPGTDAPGGDPDSPTREQRLHFRKLRQLYLQYRLLYPGLLRGGIRYPNGGICPELEGYSQSLLVFGPHRGPGDPVDGHAGVIG